MLWDIVERRQAGYQRWFVSGGVRAGLPAFFLTLVVYPLSYLSTWWSWFLARSSYDRHWAEAHPEAGPQWLPAALRSLAHYHREMYSFHGRLVG